MSRDIQGSIAMDADYSIELIFIVHWVPQYIGHNKIFIGSVSKQGSNTDCPRRILTFETQWQASLHNFVDYYRRCKRTLLGVQPVMTLNTSRIGNQKNLSRVQILSAQGGFFTTLTFETQWQASLHDFVDYYRRCKRTSGLWYS